MKTILLTGDLRQVIEHSHYPAVSIYMPTEKAGNTQQDPIRFKNLLKEAEKQLLEFGQKAAPARQLLEPARKLLDDPDFWRHQEGGLAVFLSPELAQYYTLPLNFKELVVVANRFHIKPLIPLFTDDGRFFVLALSQNQVRLLESTRYFTNEVTPKAMPHSLTESLEYGQPEKKLQHIAGKGASGVFHDHGTGKDQEKKDILRFFQQVDHGLRDILHDERAPLVLAAADFLHPIFREANTYGNLLDMGVMGNPELLSGNQLRESVWTVVKPYFERERKEAMAYYDEAAAKGLTIYDPEKIVLFAHDGRISTLFAAADKQEWAEIDLEQRKVVMQKEPTPGAQDLLDVASAYTLLKGGEVYTMESAALPGGKPLAALLRR